MRRPALLALTAASTLAVALPAPKMAQAGTVSCSRTSYDSLRDRNVSCPTARAIYRISLERGAQGQRFRARGRTWRCSASNRPHYKWTCRAKGGRRMYFAYFGGE